MATATGAVGNAAAGPTRQARRSSGATQPPAEIALAAVPASTGRSSGTRVAHTSRSGPTVSIGAATRAGLSADTAGSTIWLCAPVAVAHTSTRPLPLGAITTSGNSRD